MKISKIFNKKFLSVSLSVLVSVLFVSAVVYASTTVGLNIETGGNLLFNGTTSGTVTVKPQAEAGTWSLSLPNSDGDAGQVLSTDGAGITSWITGGIASITGDLVDNTDPVNPVVSRPYKVYTALLSNGSQYGPVVTVLENTLGGTVVWSYDDLEEGPGNYWATLNEAFPYNKTVVFFGTSDWDQNDGIVFRGGRIDNNTIKFLTTNTLFSASDYIISNTPIEIRVYP